eukprot:TRINITY_DN34768_c0_g1_i1.p1 TRINITY_DN34768_c0_g1~~TRINITY_DN34768_c0_g1_i1.p1  ORF type:complete len:104 (-),score=16.22 TRINITY_DN34768_c0_g1_i1:139-450(-)
MAMQQLARRAFASSSRRARTAPQMTGTRTAGGLPDGLQWALCVGLGTVLPTYCLYTLYWETGAQAADIGAKAEMERSRLAREQAAVTPQALPASGGSSRSATV